MARGMCVNGQRLLLIYVIGALFLGAPVVVFAQQTLPQMEAPGFKQHRDYFSEMPFENIDTLSGGLVLTFTDLVLPGNAGQELKFQRSYNSKNRGWSFGIVGIPLWISDPDIPFEVSHHQMGTPALHMSDGGTRKLAWSQPPNTQPPTVFNDESISSDFWRFTRLGSSRTLSIPNGDTCNYGAGSEAGLVRVTSCTDTFDNEITFQWQTTASPPQLVITQELSTSDSRVITVVLCAPTDPCLAPEKVAVPVSLTYNGRTWTYTGANVTPPVGPGWSFTYSNGDLVALTTPKGGVIEYTYANQSYDGPDSPQTLYWTQVVSERRTSGSDIEPGTWTYTYLIGGSGMSGETTVDLPTPAGKPHRRLLYRHGLTEVSDPVYYFDGEASMAPLAYRAVQEENGTNWTTIEEEQRTYRFMTNVSWGGDFGTVELETRTVNRDGGTTPFVTNFNYDVDNFGDYHTPKLITETGTAGTRSTFRTFQHSTSPYLLALPTSENVTVGAATFEKEWTYNASTGFKESETIYGIATTFTPDSYGNVKTIEKANGKVTQLEYRYGQARKVWTPEYPITRVINPDGTMASESRAGRTTSFTYDGLGRLLTTQPPGTNATVIAYNNTTGRSFTSTRGTSVVTTELDGFGRPIRIINPVSVETKTKYDAEGRVVRQWYPFRITDPTGNEEIWTEIEYDALGRVTQRKNPDNSISTRTYGANGLVTIQDEAGRTTDQAWQAFGDPNEARLAGIADATEHVWSYAYNALGRLSSVTDGAVARTWTWNSVNNLLDSETHPESGTTTYAYDSAGVLASKTDAKGILTTYVRDGNERVTEITAGTDLTTITYEPGSDNRTSAINSSAGVFSRYDPFTGRLSSRLDTINGKSFTTLFEYSGNDYLTAVVYPSGRRVQYDVNPAGQPEHVYELAAGRDYAMTILYHPSGGVRSYASGNGTTTTIGYDADRYWTTSVNSGPVELTYTDYDGVGNPHTIGDSRAGFDQTLDYDVLDRLTAVTGPAGPTTYAYDAYGNRAGGGYEYEPLTGRLSTNGTTAFTYDDNGNTLIAGSTTFTYTPQNQVATAAGVNGSATYAYDADEQRVRKAIVGGSTTYYIRGLGGELLTEWTDPGEVTGRIRDYVYLGSRLLSAVARTSAIDPGGINVPSTQTHRFATSWQVPSGNGDIVTFTGGIATNARKSFHPDMPSTGLRLGVQNSNVTYMVNGPLFIGNNPNPTKQGGVFVEFEIDRRPFSADGEWLGTAGGWTSTDDLTLSISPAGALVVKHDDGRIPALTLYTSAPLELHTTHTVELKFEYNSYSGPYPAPNPVWENLTSRALVFFDGALVATYGAGAGGTWNSGENNPVGLDLRYGTGSLAHTKLKSPGPGNGLLMNVFRAGLTSTADQTETLVPWRTTLLQAAGSGTYSDWTGGQPDWRARSAIHGGIGSFNAVTTTAASQKISYLMESMASRGITGNIGVVMVGIRNSYATAGSQAFIRRNGVETMLPDFTLPSSPNAGMRWYRVSEGGWSPSDTIEVGMITGGGTGNSYLTSVAVMVEHNTPEPAPLTDTSARVVTVNYTGNGTGKTIDLGVDMLPTALLVMPTTGATGVAPLIWWEGRQGAGSMSEAATTFGRVWPQKGKLQVVHPTAGNSYNANGVNYVAIALFDPSGRYVIPFGVSKPSAEDDYVHQLRLPQSGEPAVNFTPDFVFGGVSTTTTGGDATFATFYKGPGHAGDLTAKLGTATASDADRIQSLAAGEVQFGKWIGSQYGDVSFWAGRVDDGVATDRLMAVTSYVGDGTASRNIPLALNGQSPVFALVVPTTAVAKVYRVWTDTTGRQSWSGNAVANSITAVGSNQITVGTALNTIGVTYDVWAIRPGLVLPW